MESRLLKKPPSTVAPVSIIDEMIKKKREGLVAQTELMEKISEIKTKKKMDEKALELAKEKLKKAKNKRK